MNVVEITDEQVLRLDGHGVHGKCAATLVVEETVDWNYMTKDLTQGWSKGKAQLPVFYLDPDRQRMADTMWQNLPGAGKLVVKDGPFKGWVGYYRTFRGKRQ